jgi:putative MFS transporter
MTARASPRAVLVAGRFDVHLVLPSAVLITAIGFVGGVLGAAIQPLFIDRIERKYGVMAGLVVYGVGFVLLAVATGAAVVALGSFLASMGLFLTIIPAYAYTAEVFPTRARASAMGVGDGLGHAGGAVQPFVIVPLLAAFGARSVFGLLAAVAAVALLIMLSALRTSKRPLTELAR